ncbi:hemolysin III [Nematocida major]|uniref:hemolysin III n=1 Tax=Nematocida major TaxID=1912982 RepID=UPI0020088140|nr:hemolysin III [Nematocida major]KAH9385192.1 hemolysin III [Nematocida major]
MKTCSQLRSTRRVPDEHGAENASEASILGDVLSEDLSSGYVTKAAKPYWRGKVHRIAFYLTIFMYILLMITLRTNKVYLSLYFASQLVLYGVSSTYHMSNWKSRRAERLFRKLDHSSIFLLISGTQTCVVVAISELYKNSSQNILKWLPITYVLALVGIGKVFLLQTIPRYINVMYYILHGTSVAVIVPASYILKEKLIGLLCVMGGALYIVGGVIYGAKKPDPWPMQFGYHEVFHVLTVLGNLFFMMTIIWADYRNMDI